MPTLPTDLEERVTLKPEFGPGGDQERVYGGDCTVCPRHSPLLPTLEHVERNASTLPQKIQPGSE